MGTLKDEYEFTKTPDEIIADVLARYSVLDLIEQTDASLAVAETMFAKTEKDIRVIKSGTTELIQWWQIDSGGERYEVRRYEQFIFCSCKAFFFTKATCKHAYFTTKAFSRRQHKEMMEAPYLKPTSTYKPEKVGNIRI